jgi:hypothetical protein
MVVLFKHYQWNYAMTVILAIFTRTINAFMLLFATGCPVGFVGL